MKKILYTLLFAFIMCNNSYAQLPNGSIAPDFTFIDLNGTTHTLYDYLDNGYTVFIDFSAVWCPPCWGYHTSGALEDLYINHGPAGHPNVDANTTDDIMVIFVEGDGSDLACLQGTGCNTQGDWLTGTPYPIMCTGNDANGNLINTTNPTNAYQITAWPTVYMICPDKLTEDVGTASDPYSLANVCAPPAWECTGTACIDVGSGNGTFFSLGECANNCQIAETWNCIGGFDGDPNQGKCVDPGDGTGNHTDESVCEQTCITNSYNCVDASGNIVSIGSGTGVACVNPGDESGTYATLVGCQSLCGVSESWNCNDGFCEEPGDGSGTYANLQSCISANCSPPTEIMQQINYLNIQIYPNPVKNILNIKGDYSSLEIYNLYGELVLTSNAKRNINTESLSNGIYLVKIKDEKAFSISKIIISK